MYTRFIVILLVILPVGLQARDEGVMELVRRVTRGTARGISVETIAATDGKDFFEIVPGTGKVIIRGNNAVSQATGFNWYLKYVAGIHLSWNNPTCRLPSRLPLPDSTIRRETSERLRYYLNYCTFSYSMAFWDWERWEQELDWMALHGVNLCLSATGNETVWYNLLTRLGYAEGEINRFVAGPAYMAWWQMNNLEGWGGPNPGEWYEKQAALQRRVVARARELEINLAMPGFAGMVPRDAGEKLGYHVADPGKWCTFDRPAFLVPSDPNFDKVADMYYEEMEKLYGKARFYAMDPFHEGGRTGNIDMGRAGQTIMAAMKRAAPGSAWVIQAWQANPRPDMIEKLEVHDLVILDLYSEKRPQWGDPNSEWYRPDGYGKHDWLYCMLLNFGGRVGLHGRMDRVIDGFYKAREHPAGKSLAGVGATPEGIENNPVMFELLYELPWRAERFSREEWLAAYVKARYGRYHAALDEAWQLLAAYPYNCPVEYPGEGTVESLLCARPRVSPTRVSTWGSSVLYYDPVYTRQAAAKMLAAAKELEGNNNFEYDLVDVLRQAIADEANKLSGEIGNAYKAGDAARFRVLADRFLLLVRCQDELLGTRREFMVGEWIRKARSLSRDKKHGDLYEWNARALVTVWGNQAAAERGGLHDYSHREWNGLLGDLYYKRWEAFFDHTARVMQGERLPSLDFYAMEEAWTRDAKRYDSQPTGRVVPTARRVYERVFGDDKTGTR
ncbi:MAG: alpha-N-acetylglucosaminidase [Odoribacteraceae bacterium]|jgi:alpha-N-acetylglucosaminidase|nr:alpha-N-acetylglucosaminidase [Odoribacteraceae bacterium]